MGVPLELKICIGGGWHLNITGQVTRDAHALGRKLQAALSRRPTNQGAQRVARGGGGRCCSAPLPQKGLQLAEGIVVAKHCGGEG